MSLPDFAVMPTPPAGWTQRGWIPPFDGRSATADQLVELSEDLYYAVSPERRYAVDVGWYPPMDRNGQFICKVVHQDDWQNPITTFHTEGAVWVRLWLVAVFGNAQKTLEELRRALSPT